MSLRRHANMVEHIMYYIGQKVGQQIGQENENDGTILGQYNINTIP